MSPAAEAHDAWADVPEPSRPSRPRRREAVSWASAEELEVLGGIGEDPVADWTVLSLERAEPSPAEPEPTAPPRFQRAAEPAPPAAAIPGQRRTIVIRGQVAARPLEATTDRRRPARRPRERVGPRPDRVAMWAVALGVLLILVAVMTAGASG